jgi:cyclic beta-1,2-glucan synthetase
VENLEVRFLGNHDPNIHFALLTDLPDSHEQPGKTIRWSRSAQT